MLDKTKTRHIDLVVPTGWNQCTTAQLETVAQIMQRRMAMQDRYHPYDPIQLKTEAFFALSGLEVVEKREAAGEDRQTNMNRHESFGEETFLVRFRDGRPRWRRQRRPEPFELAVWQVHSFVDQHLSWLDDFTGLWLFPYPTFGHYWQFSAHWPWVRRRQLSGPAPLLDGLSWRQYRFASDWLTAYTDLNNQLAQSASKNRKSANSKLSNSQILAASEGFLKALFDVIDLKRTPRRLRQMRPDQFQLCLIWWQSMMKEMQQKYRRCFKKSSNGKLSNGQINTPVDFYTRSMTTLQDKYHLTEDEINAQPCRVILQHLEDMAREAEELERIQRQNKHKH